MKVIYINDDSKLDSLIKRIPLDQMLAIDTESYPLKDQYGEAASALDPHTSRVRLISIYWLGSKQIYVVDTHKCNNIMDLIHCIKDLLKVSHNAVYDMKAIKASFGVWFTNWKCTLVALSTLAVSTGWRVYNFRGKSLDDLSRDFFNIHLDKSLSISDWSLPNLSKKQIQYSAIDVAAPLNQDKVSSIIIEGFNLIENECKSVLQEEFAFDLDQDMVPIISRLEYSGLPVSQNVLNASKQAIQGPLQQSQMALFDALSIPIEKRLEVVDGEFILNTFIPQSSSTLLNNNKALVGLVSQVLYDKEGITLDNLQAETLLNTLKILNKDTEDTDDEEILITELEEDPPLVKKDGASLVDNLLTYKRFQKMDSEVSKYLSMINPVTGCLHTGTKIVGTSTARMSSSGFGNKALNIQQISTKSFDIDLDPAEQFVSLSKVI